MKKKDPKPGDKRYRLVPTTILVLILCGFSFYLGGFYRSENNIIVKTDARPSAQSRKETGLTPLQVKSIDFPVCSIDYQDYTPCTDPKVTWLLLPVALLK